jgi:hypothetical protein
VLVKGLLRREVEDVARLALESQRPCLELCVKHLAKTLTEAINSGYLKPQGEPTAAEDADGLQFSLEAPPQQTSQADTPAEPPKASRTGATPSENVPSATQPPRTQLVKELPCPRYSGAVFANSGRLVCVNASVVFDGDSGAMTPSSRPPRTYVQYLQRSK